MKLIIDIPEGLKQTMDNGFTSQVIVNKLWDATKNGIPLDKIRAEIEEQKEHRCFDNDDMCIYKRGLNDAIDIIDKYGKGQADENCD